MPVFSDGQYGVGHASGLMAAGIAAGSEIFQFRMAASSKLAEVNKIVLMGLGSATGFAAGAGLIELYRAKMWTANGTGGTVRTPGVDENKYRTSTMPDSMIGSIRGASTAALGVGTKVLEPNPFSVYHFSVPVTANFQLIQNLTLFELSEDGGNRLSCGLNNGFVVKITLPATGTWRFGMLVDWFEVAP